MDVHNTHATCTWHACAPRPHRIRVCHSHARLRVPPLITCMARLLHRPGALRCPATLLGKRRVPSATRQPWCQVGFSCRGLGFGVMHAPRPASCKQRTPSPGFVTPTAPPCTRLSSCVAPCLVQVKPVNLNEGVVLVGRGSDCAIRMGDDDVNTRHLRVHTGVCMTPNEGWRFGSSGFVDPSTLPLLSPPTPASPPRLARDHLPSIKHPTLIPLPRTHVRAGPLSSVAEHVGCAGGTYMRGRRIRLALLLPEDTLWLGLSATPSGMQYRVKGLCSVESRSNANTGGTAVHVEPGARGLGSSLKLPLSPGPVEPPIVHHRAKSFSFRLQLSSRP